MGLKLALSLGQKNSEEKLIEIRGTECDIAEVSVK